jgi:glutamyl-tRNA synthetase
MMIKRNQGQIVTRFAPSPTGMFHVGGIRSALYNYLFARKHNGIYFLRCEDTDKARSKKEYEQYFLDVFRWLGLEYDEYYRQSERTQIYREYLERLIQEGKAYVSKEEVKEAGKRDEVIRFRNPNTVITFTDIVLGDISFHTEELGDFVIARDLDDPIFHFAVVVDDHEMGVTHIIRGQEHVSNTPRQILIQEAIGAKRPIYAHASIILNDERAKLSKRDPSVRPALEYQTEGYLSEAMLNFMALLGWNPGTNDEVFTKQELIQQFSLERMQKPGAIFNPDKLEWVNKEHIKKLTPEQQFQWVNKFLPVEITALPQYNDERLRLITPILIERIGHFGELKQIAQTEEIAYFFDRPKIADHSLILWKNLRDKEDGVATTKTHLARVIQLLENFTGEWTRENIKQCVWPYADEVGRGEVLWPTRYALSGVEKSPDPFQLAEIFGKEESLARIRHVHDEILK